MITGFNYHPSRQGIGFWTDWEPGEIERDLRRMSTEGYNVVRFFVYWRDFESFEGRYDEEAFKRLRWLVQAAGCQGLRCIPSVLTLWMNGQVFDLPWRQGRDIWRDRTLLNRQQGFLERVASDLKDCPNLFAYDLGDEMTYIDYPAVESVTPTEADRWLASATAAIRQGDPNAKIIMALDDRSIFRNNPFGLGMLARHLDYIAIHGYPLWSPATIESNDSYKSSLYVPFLVKLAAAFGRPLVDEFGLYAASEERRSDYVTVSGTSCFMNGAEGMVGWNWKDIRSDKQPYAERIYERTTGYYDHLNEPKPSAVAFKRCLQEADVLLKGLSYAAQAAVFVNKGSFQTEEPLDSSSSACALFYAGLLLTRNNVSFDFITDRLERYKLVIVPSVGKISLSETNLLNDFVRGGGTLLYSPGNCLEGFGPAELFGIKLADYSLIGKDKWCFTYEGREHLVDWERAGCRRIPVIETTGADVLARYEGSGIPAFTVNRVGKGKAFYLNGPIEMGLDEPYALDNESYRWLYKVVIKEAGIRPLATCSCPLAEIHVRNYGDCERFIVINHSPLVQSGVITFLDGKKLELNMPKKSVTIIRKDERIIVESVY